jgi:hypothetical protein
MDALGLLLSDKTDIKSEIYNQIVQGDDYFLDQIRDELRDDAEEAGMSVSQIDELTDKFAEDDIDTLMKYITFEESDITFDYEESAAGGDLKVVAFRIPCQFDTNRYIDDASIA